MLKFTCPFKFEKAIFDNFLCIDIICDFFISKKSKDDDLETEEYFNFLTSCKLM